MAPAVARYVGDDPIEFSNRVMLEARRTTLDMAIGVYLTERNAGRFTDDAKAANPNLTMRGRTYRRQLHTIDPRFLSIPYRLTWADPNAGATEAMAKAAYAAKHELVRRAPIRSGDYLASIHIFVNGRVNDNPNPETLTNDDILHVGPTVHYAPITEHGFGGGYYETVNSARARGGVVRPVAQIIRRAFNSGATTIACRATFMEYRGSLRVPMIQIGAPNTFPQVDFRKAPRRRMRGRTRS